MRKSKFRKGKARLAFTVIVLTFPAIVAVVLFLVSRYGIIQKEVIELVIDIAALAFAFYVSLFTGYLSWRALVFAAEPRIDVGYLGDEKTGRTDFVTNEEISVKFQLRNVGWWYAKPASTNTEFFLNFDPAFSLIRARYGSQLELAEETVRRGKNDSEYFWVKGIHLYYGEPSEEIVVDTITPKEPGRYDCWISAFSEQTAHGVFRFAINVEAEESE